MIGRLRQLLEPRLRQQAEIEKSQTPVERDILVRWVRITNPIRHIPNIGQLANPALTQPDNRDFFFQFKDVNEDQNAKKRKCRKKNVLQNLVTVSSITIQVRILNLL